MLYFPIGHLDFEVRNLVKLSTASFSIELFMAASRYVAYFVFRYRPWVRYNRLAVIEDNQKLSPLIFVLYSNILMLSVWLKTYSNAFLFMQACVLKVNIQCDRWSFCKVIYYWIISNDLLNQHRCKAETYNQRMDF